MCIRDSTKAAQISGVTQSAVSQQISSLERAFKSLLIERSKKKFRLTREGQVLYDYSKQIIQTYESLHSKLQELKDIISGTIRVATIYSIGLHDLPAYVKKFMKSYPTVNIHVEYRRANQVYEDVFSNVVDLGLVAYPVKDPKIEIIALRKEPLVLVCHPQHPFAKLKMVKLKALAGQKIIGFEPDIPTRKALDKILKEHGVEVNHVMEFDNVETVKQMCIRDRLSHPRPPAFPSRKSPPNSPLVTCSMNSRTTSRAKPPRASSQALITSSPRFRALPSRNFRKPTPRSPRR